MTIKEELFLNKYENINPRQRQAVDTIFGAVMVVAGPGTGKTEVLAMRIANLLRSDVQVQPYEILCLTYTDEATNSMRRRLVQIIGPEAHKINIFTFHAFCNNVIQNNGYYFNQIASHTLQPISELERTDMLYKLLEDLPQGHKLRKLSGNIYMDTGKLNNLFNTMKQEHFTPEYISKCIDEYLAEIPEREKFIYKKNGNGFKKGDKKQKLIDEEIRRMETTRAASFLFDDYQNLMKESGRYDFNDMLLWVLEAFKQEPALLQSYQERYQFILVDEFQDTNGSQNELLNILASYWEDPNIFVVGDDDQGIYEFQGARIRNIIDFYEKYKAHINVIVLVENYRSSQLILDRAMATIKNNKQRLINQLHDIELDKNIVSSNPRFTKKDNVVKPIVNVYKNILQEEADIVLQIENLQKENTSLREIAVLYAQHKQADNIMSLLEKKGIPFNAKKSVNILELPLIEQILNVLKYLNLENAKPFEGEEVLFQILHAPYFEINSLDIAMLALYMQESKKEKQQLKWKIVISDSGLHESLKLSSAKSITRLSDKLLQWEQEINGLPLPLLLEKIVYEGGIMAHIIKTTDHVWNLQVLYTFFEFVKETYYRSQRLSTQVFLQIIERMNRESIPVPAQRVIQNENGVYFYTAHSAKGNEFEHVFLIGCTKNFWEDKRGSNNEYRLPDNITQTEEDPEVTYKTEVARRLFYVALTRAKKQLQVSYSLNDNNNKGQFSSLFLDEISVPEERFIKTVSAETILEHLKIAIEPIQDVRIKTANGQWVDKVLQQFTMSYTSLSKFLKCPVTFYFENILKAPFQKNDSLAFGTAVHYALERLFLDMKARKGTFSDKEFLLNAFNRALNAESACFTQVQFERRMEQGKTILTEYYDFYLNSFNKEVEIEFNIPRYLLQGVPITGKIDKIELDGDICKVVDYKTGDPDFSANQMTSGPNEKEPAGGDYWRQMVFYKILLENYTERNWKVNIGMFDYVQKSKAGDYKQIVVPIYFKDEEFVIEQVKTVYDKIMNREFEIGCGKETCRWCNFARRYDLVRPQENEINKNEDI